MLTLPIKKKWFDMIKSGEKKEEYRELKPYYASRFLHYIVAQKVTPNITNYVLFRNGYGKDKPTIKCGVKISKGFGKLEWGAKYLEEYYVLKILSVEEIC